MFEFVLENLIKLMERGGGGNAPLFLVIQSLSPPPSPSPPPTPPHFLRHNESGMEEKQDCPLFFIPPHRRHLPLSFTSPPPPPPPPECQLKTETQISIHSKRNRVEKRSKEKTIFAFPPAGNDWDLYPRHFLPRGAFLTRPPASTKATNYIERSQLTLHFPLLPILPLFRFESFIKRRPCFTAQSAVVHYLFIPSFIY